MLIVVHASQPCFELSAVKSKLTNKACDLEPRDSDKKEMMHFLRNSVDFLGIQCKQTYWEDNALSII